MPFRKSSLLKLISKGFEICCFLTIRRENTYKKIMQGDEVTVLESDRSNQVVLNIGGTK